MKILSANFIKGAVKFSQVPKDDLPHVVFAGRSNVGKSSIQNALLGRKKLVKVSATPGKTRELNFFLINEAFYFVDLPGIGYAKISKTKRDAISQSIQEYLDKCSNIKGIIYLVDIKTCGTKDDLEALEYLLQSNFPVMLIVTKKDKLSQKDQNKALKTIQNKFQLEDKPLAVSSLKKVGLDQVWNSILELITEHEPTS